MVPLKKKRKEKRQEQGKKIKTKRKGSVVWGKEVERKGGRESKRKLRKSSISVLQTFSLVLILLVVLDRQVYKFIYNLKFYKPTFVSLLIL